jgi:hypothetical protein
LDRKRKPIPSENRPGTRLQHFAYLGGLVKDLKQLLVISMLLIHLFNTGGYLLVFDHLEKGVGRNMIARIDQQAYDDQDLLEIRVPVNLPYQTNSMEFERVDGEVDVAGVHYNYVKRKFYNDTLILLCLPNTEKTKLFNARETFFSLVNDLQQDEPLKQSPLPVKTSKFAKVECMVAEPFALPKAIALNEDFNAALEIAVPQDLFDLSPERPPECLPA